MLYVYGYVDYVDVLDNDIAGGMRGSMMPAGAFFMAQTISMSWPIALTIMIGSGSKAQVRTGSIRQAGPSAHAM